MFENIKADLNRFAEEAGSSSSFRILVRGLLSQGFQAILVYRFFRWFHIRGIPTQPFRFFIERFTEIMTGISIPAGFDKGLPIGMQFIGKPFGEETILKVAYAYEQATEWHKMRAEIK